MCGIARIYIHNMDVSNIKDLTIRMRDTMIHRGPDDMGLYLSKDKRLCLAHTRLSIIDLSSAGHQPMSNEDESIWTVYNGEIYNYREIRKLLIVKGHKFLNCPVKIFIAFSPDAAKAKNKVSFKRQ